MPYWHGVERGWRDTLACLIGRHKIATSEPGIGLVRCSCGAGKFDSQGRWSSSIDVWPRSARRAAKNAAAHERLSTVIRNSLFYS